MNENPEQQTTEDVLRASALTARLLRRLTASPGIIDLHRPQQNYARLLALPARAGSLCDELMTRYGLVDGAAERQPLVMEQPWLLSVNAYLTNNSSFSSTITQFISGAAAGTRAGNDDVGRMEDERRVVAPAQLLFPRDGGAPAAERFRVSRSRVGRAWEVAPAARPEDDKVSVAQAAVEQREQTRAIAPPVAAPDNPPLVQTQVARPQIQRMQPDESINAAPPRATTNELEGAQQQAGSSAPAATVTAAIKPHSARQTNEAQDSDSSARPALAQAGARTPTSLTSLPLQRSAAERDSSAKPPTDTDNKIGLKPKSVAPEVAAHSSPRAARASLDLVQTQSASARLQRREPEFVWRKGAPGPTAHESASNGSDGSATGAARRTVAPAAPVQSAQSRPTAAPEATRRSDEPRAGARLTTERIMRHISRRLIVERERRGY